MATKPTQAHQSPGFSLPPLRMKQINTTTWGTGGNTLTLNDPYIFPNSQVEAWVTGTVPAAGQWAYNITAGQCVITSSNAENASLPVSYIIF